MRAYVGGTWGSFGTACTLTTPSTSLAPTQLRSDFCGITLPSLNSTTKIYCDPVVGATNYEWQITDVATGNVVFTKQRSAQWTDFYLKGYFTTILYNHTYSIKVRAYVNGVWGTFGNACNLTTPAVGARYAFIGVEETELESSVNINAYPNPTSEVLNIDFDNVPTNASVEIYNMVGELVLTQQLSALNNTINTTSLANGLYHAKIIGNNKLLYAQKIVKQ